MSTRTETHTAHPTCPNPGRWHTTRDKIIELLDAHDPDGGVVPDEGCDLTAARRDWWGPQADAILTYLRAEGTSDEGAVPAMTGQIRGLAFEDGEPHEAYCGLEDCECPDHDETPRPAGTYLTIRLDGQPAVGMWPVRIERLVDEPETMNGGEHAG